ncbi:Alpha-D-GlcNAc alpha-1,2-L-rhamnosyltransferase [Rhodococcus wratislaviensis]|uniref:Alpha-D-GlcNAc alpha-1,2-L-rhamnosyltransferase n=1 Tax=Rhodococcus wratislaviensis TaxID=44752 RepID=A0A402BYE5_RHOWR|nr:DUF1972 domain-containing protein [Rhodococcus wratislaviensis]GCE36405.1 Alpha-D-GlcNAc alpha-1,2-L-rhamnosyltransferase [Rhodococcus wratislaviensis]
MPIGSVAIIGTRGYPSFYGGFETLIRKLAPFLADRGWDVSVYGRPGTTDDCASDRHPQVESITTRGIESKTMSTLTYGASSVLDAARRRPDVALVMNVANGYWLPALKARRIPTVINVDGIEWERAKWGTLAKTVFKSGAQMTARFGDVLVCDSHEIASYWRENFRRDSVFIAYGGDIPSRKLPTVKGLRRQGYALMVARFVPENTVSEFVDAAETLSDLHDIVIVGSSGYGGPLDDKVRALSQRRERVIWMGQIADDSKLFSLWQNAGTYFHGHSVGGTNPALVQAMACGAPTVARNTVYNREVLEDSGVFVAPDPGDIANAIHSVMNSPQLQRSLGIGAQERAQAVYQWDDICAHYENTLRVAMRSKTRGCG